MYSISCFISGDRTLQSSSGTMFPCHSSFITFIFITSVSTTQYHTTLAKSRLFAKEKDDFSSSFSLFKAAQILLFAKFLFRDVPRRAHLAKNEVFWENKSLKRLENQKSLCYNQTTNFREGVRENDRCNLRQIFIGQSA